MEKYSNDAALNNDDDGENDPNVGIFGMADLTWEWVMFVHV